MDDRIYRVQIEHLRRCLSSLRLLDLSELAACAETQGTDADKELIAAVRHALATLPEGHH